MAKTRRLPNISLADCPLSMGRSSDNDLVLQHTTVSRRHCLIEIEDGAAVLRDLSSRHGTRVNGRKVEETTNVADGDLIRV
ncbi:MAG: FHA domain-containing protein, partial [Planctomycetota bacterium]